MNLRELRAELAFQLNAEEDAVDQSFTTDRLSKALQQAYTREWERAKLHANQDWVKGMSEGGSEYTWPADAIRYVIPEGLKNKTILDIWDMSAGENGIRLVPDVDYQFSDRVTLQWIGTTGPGSARPLRFYYEVVAEPLVDEEEPKLIPPQFHELIVISAACKLKSTADEATVAEWISDRNELRLDFWKYLSLGRPTSHPPVAAPSDQNEQTLLLT